LGSGEDSGPFEYVTEVLVRLYHRSRAAEAILRDGFVGGSGTYLTNSHFEDVVWLSDSSELGNQEVPDGAVFQVDVPVGVGLDVWEVVEEGKPFREWAIPADVVNAWPRTLIAGE
jgi:hypothetical protein